MKHILLLVTALMTLSLQAQIEIESMNLNVGDVVYLKRDITNTYDLQTSGENLNWDISNLSAPFMDSIKPINPANTTHASLFSEANLAFSTDTLTAYISSTPEAFVMLGIAGSMQGYPVLAKFEVPDTITKFPLNYGDSRVSEAGGETEPISVALPGIGEVEITVHHFSKRTSECDAWGTMKTTDGTYDVLRVKEEIITIDSIFMPSPLPFMDPIFVEAYSPFDTTYQYSFFTNNPEIKMPLAEIKFNPETNMALSTMWVTFPSSTDVFEREPQNNLTIYPNPCSNYLNIKTEAFIEHIKVCNVNGQTVIETNQPMIDVSNLPSAVYFVNVQTKDKTFVKRIIVN